MLKTVKTVEVPKRTRTSKSRFESTPEWPALRAQMLKGIKPGVSQQITVSEEEKELYGITNRRTIARFLEKFIEANGLEYGVRTFVRDGLDFVVVDGPPKG